MQKRVPARRGRCEIRVSRSRFIASAAPVFSVEEARRFIEQIRKEFPDATHHVPAYLIGHGPTVSAHCQDDGEPSGTAGRPVLSVLQGSGLGDVAVVVSRYFGGAKLGSGGLVRAYSEAVRQVLRELPVAEKRLAHTVLLACPYSGLRLVRQAVQRLQGQILEEEFAAQVRLRLRLPASHYERFQAEIAQISKADWMPEIQETSQSILPIRGDLTQRRKDAK